MKKKLNYFQDQIVAVVLVLLFWDMRKSHRIKQKGTY